MRNAFRDGDVWFNTGDLMRSQGFGHAAFTDQFGDTFRWKGENVATTEVEAALSTDPQVEEATVFGVEVPGTGGRAGMAAIQLKKGAELDGQALAKAVYERLPGYAVPLVRPRRRGAGAHVDPQEPEGGPAQGEIQLRTSTNAIYVLAGRDEGYVPFYDEYPEEVKAGKRPPPPHVEPSLRLSKTRHYGGRVVDLLRPPSGRRSSADHGDREPDPVGSSTVAPPSPMRPPRRRLTG